MEEGIEEVDFLGEGAVRGRLGIGENEGAPGVGSEREMEWARFKIRGMEMECSSFVVPHVFMIMLKG